MKASNYIDELTGRFPGLQPLGSSILNAASLLTDCFRNGGKLLICGNGGSAADADHIAGELLKGFEKPRPLEASVQSGLIATGGHRGAWLAGKLQQGLPVISLASHAGLMTAVANDTDPSLVFAQQVVSYGRDSDILIAISTSGNSQNVIDAIITARSAGMKVICLTGKSGGAMAAMCDILLNVPETETARVQELHLPLYHTLCRILEEELYG
ncbi:MAG: SIS domain-containing protein [Bacteroidales bacterium]|nr:SIS domain-containing protein [Bacteroidales bacterium]